MIDCRYLPLKSECGFSEFQDNSKSYGHHNHTPVFNVLICRLNLKFTSFKEFYLASLFRIKREAPVIHSRQKLPVLKWNGKRTAINSLTASCTYNRCRCSRDPEKSRGQSATPHRNHVRCGTAFPENTMKFGNIPTPPRRKFQNLTILPAVRLATVFGNRQFQHQTLFAMQTQTQCNLEIWANDWWGCSKFSAFDWLSQLGHVGFEFTLQITFDAETVC